GLIVVVNGSRRKIDTFGIGMMVRNGRVVIQKCGFNCQSKDVVMSYIPIFSHNKKVLPSKITDQSSLLVYLERAVRPILRVYVDENPTEEDHKLE
ncbi:hypothetical protein H5410_006113, partial [Solanum commersonii]